MSNLSNQKYVIYVHTNLINGKQYVGQTRTSLQRRFGKNGSHYKNREYPSNHPKQNIFYKAILKYGWENFKHEILETDLNSKEADEKEIYYIKLFHTWVGDPECNGYNSTKGGKENLEFTQEVKDKISKTVKDKWENDKEYKEKTIQAIRNTKWTEERKEKARLKLKEQKKNPEFMKKLNEGRSAWTKAAFQEGGILYNRFNGENNPNAFSIICLNTGEIFSTCAEACAKYNIDSGSMSKAINKKLKHAGIHPTTGVLLSWEKYEEGKQYNIIGINKDDNIYQCDYDLNDGRIKQSLSTAKPVICIEKSIYFISASDAMKHTNIDKTSIGRCCTGKQKTAGGYHWKYLSKEEFIEKCKLEKEMED